MIRFYSTPRLTRYWYPSLTWKIESKNSIFLTFDDGPHPDVTPWILDQLERANAKATFFCLGKNIESYPHLMKLIVEEAHQIGNHTYSHLNGWKSSDSLYSEDINLCDEVMMEQKLQSNLFRPPYGRIKKSQIKKLRDKRIVMWSHLSWDFDQRLSLTKSIHNLKQARPGSILVFHESEKAYQNLKVILPAILSHFQSKGVKFEAIL